jgi:hypothetical protein
MNGEQFNNFENEFNIILSEFEQEIMKIVVTPSEENEIELKKRIV